MRNPLRRQHVANNHRIYENEHERDRDVQSPRRQANQCTNGEKDLLCWNLRNCGPENFFSALNATPQ